MTASKTDPDQGQESTGSTDDSTDGWDFNPTIKYRTAPTQRSTPGVPRTDDWPRTYDPTTHLLPDEEVHRLEDLLPEHRPDVPEDIVWSDYVSYQCRRRECQDQCINRVDSLYAAAKLCRGCFPEVDVTDLNQNSQHLPAEERWRTAQLLEHGPAAVRREAGDR